MDLYTLVVTLDIPGVQWRLLYKTEARARADHRAAVDVMAGNPLPLELTDDYGCTITTTSDRVAAVSLNHASAVLNGEADFNQIVAHAQANWQKRMAADPMLRSSIIQPANGPMPFGRN